MSNHNSEISKFLSYLLRHRPDSIGLSLDNEGWAVIDDLIQLSINEGYKIDNGLLRLIIQNSDKKRFIISEDGLKIRAIQAHSTQKVNRTYNEQTPLEILYHGTATRFLSSIKQIGLVPKARQYVHLSHDQNTAFWIGQRYGKAIILTIKSLERYQQGFKFYQAENGVWLTNSVPVQFIE